MLKPLNVVRRYIGFRVILAAFAAGSLLSCTGRPPDVDEFGKEAGRAEQPLTALIQINSGSGTVSPFAADHSFSQSNVYSVGNVVSTDGVTDAAPAAVYQSERYGNFSYTLAGLSANTGYRVRLHFAEIYFTSVGQRRFNVAINGTEVLSDFDIFAIAGANKALVREFPATSNANGQIAVDYRSVVENAKASALEVLLDGSPGQPPTVVQAASANPNPVTSTTSTLTVLGADDGGEANLTYSWAATGAPPGPVTFSASGTNGAKRTVANFSTSGNYTLSVTIRDQAGLTATSTANVTVGSANQPPTVQTPASANPNPVNGTTTALTVLGSDNGGETNLAYTWSATGSAPGGVTFSPNGTNAAKSTVATFGSSGTYTLQATIRDQAGLSTTSSVTVAVSSAAAVSAVYRINLGGGAISPFQADQFASGGSAYSTYSSISTNGVANAAPASVYQDERFGDYAYTLGNLTPNGSYVVRLHFAEIYWTAVGARRFNVSVNGTQVLTNFDIFANVGANKALVRDFPATANSSGQIRVQYQSITDNATSAAIEVLSTQGDGSQGGTGGASGSGGAGGTGGASSGGTSGSGASGQTIFYDDFLGASLDTSKWSLLDRISDQANRELNCCVPENVSLSGGILSGITKFEDRMCGDSQQAPVLMHYTSWQIQQKTAPFQYGTVEVRAKVPGGTGIWPVIWMLGYLWQPSQPATANTPEHQWPQGGWGEIDIAEFWQNARTRVNPTVHFNTPGGIQEQPLPFDATTRFMVYRLQWSASSLIWSVNAEDGVGYRTLYTVTDRVPNVPMYIVINAAVGGNGGGTPNPSTFPQTFLVDWVRVTQ